MKFKRGSSTSQALRLAVRGLCTVQRSVGQPLHCRDCRTGRYVGTRARTNSIREYGVFARHARRCVLSHILQRAVRPSAGPQLDLCNLRARQVHTYVHRWQRVEVVRTTNSESALYEGCLLQDYYTSMQLWKRIITSGRVPCGYQCCCTQAMHEQAG